MGEHLIKMPDVGEGIAEAELVEWHVKVGDLVREDAVLAAVMTDKATVEIPSPVDGEVLWLGAEIGDVVAIGSPLIRLKVEGGDSATSDGSPEQKADEPPAQAEAIEAQADGAVKGFLYPRMYRHQRVMRIMGDAEGVVCDLFARYVARPEDIPAEWAQGAETGDEPARLRRIADFIAGMTDRYALTEHARLFPSTPELR